MQGIYKITNKINNKVYIGKSTNIEDRWKNGHISKLNKNKHDNDHLQFSWNKYGQHNFEFSIIEECTEELLNKREIYWIDYYKSYNPEYGYNMTYGGDGGKPTEETKQKISKSLIGKMAGEKHPMYGKKHSEQTIEKCKLAFLGRKHTEESKLKISKSQKGKILSEETKRKISENHADFSGKNHPLYGKHHSEETRKKISKSNKGKTISKEATLKRLESRKGYKHSKETIEKIRESNKGKIITEECKQKISQANKGKTAWNKGLKIGTIISEETRKKMSNSQKGRITSEETKRKISESNRGRKLSTETKEKLRKIKIEKYKNDPKIIAIINDLKNQNKSIKEIAESLNVKIGVVYNVRKKIKNGEL